MGDRRERVNQTVTSEMVRDALVASRVRYWAQWGIDADEIYKTDHNRVYLLRKIKQYRRNRLELATKMERCVLRIEAPLREKLTEIRSAA